MKRFSFLITFIIIFSCSKEKGIIPNQSKTSPFYPDIKGELIWQKQADVPSHMIFDEHLIIADKLLIANIIPGQIIQAYDIKSGEKRWEIDVRKYTMGHDLDKIKVIKEGAFIYIVCINNVISLKVNYTTGNVINSHNAEELGYNPLYNQSGLLINEELFFINNKYGGKTNLIKYDVFKYTAEEVVDLSDHYINDEISSPILNNNHIYFLVQNYNQQYSYFLIDINLEEKSSQKLWVSDDAYSSLGTNLDFTMIENQFIFEKTESEIISVDISMQEVRWSFFKEKRNEVQGIYSQFGHLLLNIRDHLLKLDPESGNLIWRTNHTDINNHINFKKDFLIAEREASAEDHICIYDLTNGQNLVEWALPEGNSIRSLKYQTRSNTIYVSTVQGPQKSQLLQYTWPLNK